MPLAPYLLLGQVLSASGFHPEKTWGEVVEDRGSQITFSAPGQEAPLAEKVKRDPETRGDHPYRYP